MATKAEWKPAAELHMDRRIIRVDSLPDQAGIAAALRRAFATRPANGELEIFEDLLKRLH